MSSDQPSDLTVVHRINVSDLLNHPGTARREEGAVQVVAALPDASVDDLVSFKLDFRSLSDGVVARGSAVAGFDLRCSACLVEWGETMNVSLEAVYRFSPRDEEESPIETGGWVDVGPLIHDEVSLSLPLAPHCRPDCRGLCPTCGTDLNTDPCDGHEDEVGSPFAVLKGLLEEMPDEPQPPENQ